MERPLGNLQEFCAVNKFERFAAALEELGVTEVAELADVTDEELAAIGMSLIHTKRLRRNARAPTVGALGGE